MVGAVMDRPPWRYALGDGRLHMIRRETGGMAQALCPLRIATTALLEPGHEDQPRCACCVRVYGAELAASRGVKL
jgi:hypothetical protein